MLPFLRLITSTLFNETTVYLTRILFSIFVSSLFSPNVRTFNVLFRRFAEIKRGERARNGKIELINLTNPSSLANDVS